MEANQPTLSVADAIIHQLAAADVQRIYGVVGDALFPFVDALARQNNIQFIATTHETQAAFMASYEAKLTGQLAVCMATAGPGTTNLATGIADAHFDQAPVLAISGQVETKKIGTQTKQYFAQQHFMSSLSGRTELIVAGEAALNTLTELMLVALIERKVVHLSIPKDVFSQPVRWTPLPVTAIPVATTSDNQPTESNLSTSIHIIGDRDQALDTLLNARRPLVVIGVTERQTTEQAIQFARTLGAAVVVAQQAKGAVPFNENLLIGGIGEAHVPDIVGEADIIILVGNAPYELPFLSPHTPIFVLTTKPVLFPTHTVLAEIIGNPLHMLAWLEKNITNRSADTAWTHAIHNTRIALEQQIEQLNTDSPDGPINPYHLAFTLSQTVAEDAIVTLDTGAFTHWFDLGFRTARQDILTSPHWRGMGAALPAAIAAKLAAPERQVISVIGDGGMLMSLSELLTAVRYELPLLLIIVRNETYDIEEQKMRWESFTPIGTRLQLPDFAAYARSCGALGFTVHDKQAFSSTLPEAFVAIERGKQPVLVEVHTSTPELPHSTA